MMSKNVVWHFINAKGNFLILVLVCFLSCLICVLLQKESNLSPVLASAVVGLFGSFVPKVKLYDYKEVRAIIYTSSFVGMTSILELEKLLPIVVLSVLTTAIFIFTKQLFQGIGGKMGTTAFTSVVIFSIFGSAL